MIRMERVKYPLIRRTDSRIIAKVNSYEIVCTTAHKAPVSVYFELEAQPGQSMEYTAKLDMASINRTPGFMLIRGWGMGKGIHMVRARLWRRRWHPTPALLPGKSHGWRSLVGRSPWGR